MIVAKQVADFFTFSRLLLLLVLPWIGVAYGPAGLPLAALAMIYSWASDAIDGTLARRSSRAYHTWIGDHDLEADTVVSVGLLIFMLVAGFVSTKVGGLYFAGWLFIFALFGFQKSLGMTFQAPIYGWFLWVTLQNAPVYGVAMVIWIIGAILVTWPRFPKEVIPGYMNGFRSLVRRKR